MKIKDLRGLSKEELQDKMNELHKQLMQLQFKRKGGVEKPHQFKEVKKSIAKILTVMNENEGAKGGKR